MPANQSTPEVTRAEQTICDALMDSQYMAGVTAGWNAAQADDPEAALTTLRKSREGHMAGYADAKAVLSATPARGGDELREAARAMLPKELCLTNENWADGTIVPIDVTLGELRRNCRRAFGTLAGGYASRSRGSTALRRAGERGSLAPPRAGKGSRGLGRGRV